MDEEKKNEHNDKSNSKVNNENEEMEQKDSNEEVMESTDNSSDEKTMQKEKMMKDATAPAVDSKTSMVMPVVVGGGVLVLALGGLALISNRPADSTPVDVDSYAADALLNEVEYYDGIYYTEARYYVDALEAEDIVGVTVVVEDGEIQSVELVQLNEEGEEQENEYLEEFVEKLTDKVVGVHLTEVEGMELISGSTLTSDAFKEAVREFDGRARVQQDS